MNHKQYTTERRKGKHLTLVERGSNENNNKLIRRYIPKGEDIGKYSKEDIKNVEKWMNEYPRELFQGKTSNEMYEIFYRNSV